MRGMRKAIFGGFMEDDDETIMFVFRRPFLFSILQHTWRVLFTGVLAMFLLWYDHVWEYYYVVKIVGVCLFLIQVISGWAHWYVNAIIMTTEGLVFIKWPKFFHRAYERIDFHNLDEVEVTRNGIKAFFWNYGTLNFQKVNGGEQLSWKYMVRPQKVARRVEHYREVMIDEKNFTEESALKGLLQQMVQTHVGRDGQPLREDGSKHTRNKGSVGGRSSWWKLRKSKKSEIYEEDIEEVFAEELDEKVKNLVSRVERDEDFEEEYEKVSRQESEQEHRRREKEHKYLLELKAKEERRKKQRRRVEGGVDINVEKRLDDTGGVGIDLD